MISADEPQGATADSVKARFTEALSRARPKELARDYLERLPSTDTASLADLVARDAERSRNNERDLSRPGLSPIADLKARQREAAERWKSRPAQARQQEGPKAWQDSRPTHTPTHKPEQKPELRHDGPEDDLEL